MPVIVRFIGAVTVVQGDVCPPISCFCVTCVFLKSHKHTLFPFLNVSVTGGLRIPELTRFVITAMISGLGVLCTSMDELHIQTSPKLLRLCRELFDTL
jgi:hypothetical protein